jgi:hypothetical protein
VSAPESKLPDDETATATPLQRVLIAGATLIVVALTVVAAILLAVRNPAGAPPPPVFTPPSWLWGHLNRYATSPHRYVGDYLSAGYAHYRLAPTETNRPCAVPSYRYPACAPTPPLRR